MADKKSTRSNSAWLSVRLTTLEWRQATAYARHADISLSELVRSSCESACAPIGEDYHPLHLHDVLQESGRYFNAAAYEANSAKRRYGRANVMDSKSTASLIDGLDRFCKNCSLATHHLQNASEDVFWLLSNKVRVIDIGRARTGDMRDRVVVIRLTEDQRTLFRSAAKTFGASVSMWARIATMARVATGSNISDSLIITSREVDRLLLAAIKWRTNHEQIGHALMAVRRAQKTSRYVNDRNSERVDEALRNAMRESDNAWSTFITLISPLEKSGIMNGAELCRN